jgi:hypothetical protein
MTAVFWLTTYNFTTAHRRFGGTCNLYLHGKQHLQQLKPYNVESQVTSEKHTWNDVEGSHNCVISEITQDVTEETQEYTVM